MELSYPAYYDQFSCLAGACPDSCCKEWEVEVDGEAAERYRQLPGELGQRLRTVLRKEDGYTFMTIENGRCPMWRQDGLCRIHAQLGHDALCQTCRDYPRLRHDYGDFQELGLELSCPEAARLIFSDEQQILTQTLPGGDAPDYDMQLMDILKTSRAEFLAFLDKGACDIPQTLAVLLLYGYEVQNWIDGGQPAQLVSQSCLELAAQCKGQGNLKEFVDYFKDLEILTQRWQARLDSAPMVLSFSEKLRHLVRYGVRRYWLQAVSDYDLVCRVKLIIISCILVDALGGDMTQTAQLYSKEIENDPENVERILDGAYTALPFTDTNLLSLLMI